MVKPKSSDKIEAQIDGLQKDILQCRSCVDQLKHFVRSWRNLNRSTRATFKGSESTSYDVLKKALEESDGHIANLEKLVGRIGHQRRELQKQISELQNELTKLRSSGRTRSP